jgi:hypothetical protein
MGESTSTSTLLHMENITLVLHGVGIDRTSCEDLCKVGSRVSCCADFERGTCMSALEQGNDSLSICVHVNGAEPHRFIILQPTANQTVYRDVHWSASGFLTKTCAQI